MSKLFKLVCVFSFLLTIIFFILYKEFCSPVLLTFLITFATIFYHFGMRMAVGYIYDISMKNSADYNKKWYRPLSWEPKFYELIKIKKWKKYVPSYSPELFDLKKHSIKEVIMAMCQAELVHETIFILSFLPIAFSYWLGAFSVFFITSLVSAFLDLSLVMVQRYNRPRLIKILNKKGRL